MTAHTSAEQLGLIVPAALPFATRPCICATRHVPKPVRVELHHLHMQAHQRRLWGRVRDHETVALCDNGHSIVHWIMDRLRKEEPGLDGSHLNSYLYGIAREGLRRERAAEAASA